MREIFNDLNRNMRLIGTFAPLLGGDNDRPSDSFERTALNRALTGQAYTAVKKVNDTWYYRRSIPLSNTFHQNCVLCHSNFTTDVFTSTFEREHQAQGYSRVNALTDTHSGPVRSRF